MNLTRTAFPFPGRTPSWFAGHMARSLRELPALLDEVDLVLEARDARLPLTSVNHAFDAMLERVWGHCGAGPDRRGKGKEKIVVYTKRDLAEARYEGPLKRALWKQARQAVLFADSRVDSDVRNILRVAARKGVEYGDAIVDLKVLVVGMPNVGKSSLLNALRRVGVKKGKVFTTGAMPGVTRKLTGTVRVYDKPPIYVFDTPGVMVPFLGHSDVGAERGMKLALSAGIKEGLFEPEAVADYLLYKMNLRLAAEQALGLPWKHESYISKLPLPPDFPPTDNVQEFLNVLAHRLGALRKGAEADIEASTNFLLRQFREGKIGRWTLDDLDGAEAEYIAKVNGEYEAQSPHVEAVQTPKGYVLSDMGAVGASGESDSPGDHTADPEVPADLSVHQAAQPPRPLTLDQRVSSTVSTFLEKAAQERADAEAGRNRSSTQQKKAELREKAEYRIAKARAKGFGAGGGGSSGKGGSGGRGGGKGGGGNSTRTKRR